MAYENLLVDVSERIATVTFNRPKSLNALNPPTVRELGTAMEEISSREDVGVVLLTGSGEKAFIAGADISEMKAFTTMQALDFELATILRDEIKILESHLGKKIERRP